MCNKWILIKAKRKKIEIWPETKENRKKWRWTFIGKILGDNGDVANGFVESSSIIWVTFE